MFRNCLAAALRHLARNKLYTAISVLGLSVGLCTALLAALVIHNQYTYDHSVPHYERTYIVQLAVMPKGLAKQYVKYTTPQIGAQIKVQLPDVEATSRVLEADMRVQYGTRISRETIYWADPNVEDVLPMAHYAGDLTAALHTADSIVLSHSYARRFFGRDAPLGETLLIDGHPMLVRAVFRDQPNSTHQRRDIIASGISSYSPNSTVGRDELDKYGGLNVVPGMTYVRLRAGAQVETVRTALQRLLQVSSVQQKSPFALLPELIRIDRFNTNEGLHSGFRSRMMLLGMLGAVVLLIASLNFVNLQTARSTLRAREAAIRTVAGASRQLLIVQFLGESLLYAAAAGLLAIALTEWLLPQVDAFLDAGADLGYAREPWLIACLTAATLLLGLVAGAWPAFVQSRIRPVTALRGTATVAAGTAVRAGLTTLQFALLIALSICAGVVDRQRNFAMHDALRLDRDQVLMIHTPHTASHPNAFVDQLRALPGVTAVTWGSVPFLGNTGYRGLRSRILTVARGKSGDPVFLDVIDVDFNIFDFYGIKPLAGHLPGSDSRIAAITDPTYVVLNETAARKFGLTPTAAVGKFVSLPPLGKPVAIGGIVDSMIVAVVQDFSLNTVAAAVPATVYIQPNTGTGLDLNKLDLLNVRLSGRDVPETLAAIDALWRRTVSPDPPARFFLDEHIELLYQAVLRQSQAFGICALIAMSLSCIGLFAVTAATAERRTKEIGIRKALGADTGDVLMVLLWQFTRPVMWASVVAWVAAGYVMRGWLAGFAYHIDLPLWMFPAAAVAALLIALATVTTQSVLVARSRPVAALRYE